MSVPGSASVSIRRTSPTREALEESIEEARLVRTDAPHCRPDTLWPLQTDPSGT